MYVYVHESDHMATQSGNDDKLLGWKTQGKGRYGKYWHIYFKHHSAKIRLWLASILLMSTDRTVVKKHICRKKSEPSARTANKQNSWEEKPTQNIISNTTKINRIQTMLATSYVGINLQSASQIPKSPILATQKSSTYSTQIHHRQNNRKSETPNIETLTSQVSG